MKKSIILGTIVSMLLLSFDATARITTIEKYKFEYGSLASPNAFSCENINGMRSNIPAGYTCTKVRVQNHDCYKNCHCDYSYTESNCSGTLGGGICDKNGVIYHEKCTVCNNTVTADDCSSPTGSTCTKNGVTYYESCGCTNQYTAGNCDGTLGGGSCKRGGVEYYASCSVCNYTVTANSCSAPVGASCTKDGVTYYENCGCTYSYTGSNCNGTLGGGSCKRGGITYHETCTPCTYTHTTANCNPTSGASCIKDGTTYYETCGCTYTYNSSNCTGTLSGSTCKREGNTYYQSCMALATCNYTWSTDNCSQNKLSGDSCFKNNKTYYENCNCNYTNTSSNCSNLSGDSCMKNGTTYRQYCSCNYNYNSNNCSSLTGSTCKRNNITYYSGCNDPVCDFMDGIHDYYRYVDGDEITSNCLGNVGGDSCQYDENITLYSTCTPCAGNYPYSSSNCVHPTGNSCTLPDYDDNYDPIGGGTYYQSCNSPVSVDCNAGDWVYRLVGYYRQCYHSAGNTTYIGHYYPECQADGNDFTFIPMQLKDVSSYGIYHEYFDIEVPLPPFVCVSHSTALTAADLAVWSGGLSGDAYYSDGDPNYGDLFVPAMAPLTYGVDLPSNYGGNYRAYGGYKLTGIYLGDGVAVDISGWPCSSTYNSNVSSMECGAYNQWFGSKGVKYQNDDNNFIYDAPNAIEENQWGDGYCGGISSQACNSSNQCYPQNDISAISCATGDNAGLINTLHNGERSFTYSVLREVYYSYQRVEVEGMVYPANLCLGKNLNSVSGYAVPANSGEYSGMVYYYVPTDDEWMSYHNPISAISPILAQFRNTFNSGSEYRALPWAISGDGAYWSSTCSRGDFNGDNNMPGSAANCYGGNTYILNKIYKQQYSGGSAISGAYHMTGIQKNGPQNFTYYKPMYNISPSSKTGSNAGVTEVRTQCFISMSGYNAE